MDTVGKGGSEEDGCRDEDRRSEGEGRGAVRR